jgi:hypothetical protein
MRSIIALAFLVLSACSGGQDVAIADAGIAQFHAQFNAGKMAQIQEGASPEWRAAMPTPEALKFLLAVRQKLGPFQSGKQTGWNVNYSTNGTFIVVQYESKFEKGKAVETFTFRRSDDEAQLAGYNINSNVLVTG